MSDKALPEIAQKRLAAEQEGLRRPSTRALELAVPKALVKEQSAKVIMELEDVIYEYNACLREPAHQGRELNYHVEMIPNSDNTVTKCLVKYADGREEAVSAGSMDLDPSAMQACFGAHAAALHEGEDGVRAGASSSASGGGFRPIGLPPPALPAACPAMYVASKAVQVPDDLERPFDPWNAYIPIYHKDDDGVACRPRVFSFTTDMETLADCVIDEWYERGALGPRGGPLRTPLESCDEGDAS